MLSKNSKYYFVFLLLLRGGLLSSIDVATGILKVDANIFLHLSVFKVR